MKNFLSNKFSLTAKYRSLLIFVITFFFVIVISTFSDYIFRRSSNDQDYIEQPVETTNTEKEKYLDTTFEKIDEMYSKDKVHVYKNRQVIENADPNSFEVIRDNYSRDEKHVFYNFTRLDNLIPNEVQTLDENNMFISDGKNIFFTDKQIVGSDPSSFRVLSSSKSKDQLLYPSISADKKSVYIGNNRIGDTPDYNSLDYVGPSFIKDKDGYYLISSDVNLPGITKINLGGIKRIDFNYIITNNSVYYFTTQIKFVDVESFVGLNSNYGKDKNHVYINGKILQNADPETFELLSRQHAKDAFQYYNNHRAIPNYEPQYICKDTEIQHDSLPFKCFGENFYIDQNQVYFYNIGSYPPRIQTKLITADPDSFELIEGVYAKDRNNIYFKDEIIHNVDRESFNILPFNNLSYDKNYIFRNNKMIRSDGYSIEGSSLRQIYSYTKDNHNVYTNSERFSNYVVLSVADPSTFEFLAQFKEHTYAKDHQNLFDKSKIVENLPDSIDIPSFTFVGTAYQKDKNSVYLNFKSIEGADPDTFILVNHDMKYTKDKNSVYYEDKKIEGADTNTFRFLSKKYSRDYKHIYWEASRLIVENIENFDPRSEPEEYVKVN